MLAEKSSRFNDLKEKGLAFVNLLIQFFRSTRGLLFIIACVVTVLTIFHYLIVLTSWTTIGFPLDDSWIHLQFARTIYEGTPWEYSPGRPSTGSTSPLWSLVLSTLFYFTTNSTLIIIGVYMISGIFYILCTFIVGLLIVRHTQRSIYAVVGMIAFVLTPRVSWLMLSGMEFPLFLFVLLSSIFILERLERNDRYILGALLGFAYLSRPEGVLLVGLGLLLWSIYLTGRIAYRQVFEDLLTVILVAVVIVLPWVVHCLCVTGYPLPDTFYAKVSPVSPETVAIWNKYWLTRLVTLPFLIIGILLGAVMLESARPYLWVYPLILTLIYRSMIPGLSLINNARYQVPIFALFMICAVIGIANVFDRLSWLDVTIPRVGTSNIVAVILVIGLLLIPIVPQYTKQSNLYGNAVKNINEMQVDIGIWLRDHTPEDAVIATHDVGAIRFFSNRTIIDLAGLVSPEILHANMTLLETLRYLHNQSCSYIAFFDELFIPYSMVLGDHYTILYTVHLNDNIICGRDTMSVYFVNWTEISII